MPRNPPGRPFTVARVACSVSVCPPRCTVTGTVAPGLTFLMAVVSCVYVVTATPSNEVILSPGLRPARLAGDFALLAVQGALLLRAVTLAGTQADTVPSWVLLSFSIPM